MPAGFRPRRPFTATVRPDNHGFGGRLPLVLVTCARRRRGKPRDGRGAERGRVPDQTMATAKVRSSNIAARDALGDSAPLAARSDIADDHWSLSCGLRSVAASCRAQWSDTGSEQARMHRSVGQDELRRAYGARVRRTQ